MKEVKGLMYRDEFGMNRCRHMTNPMRVDERYNTYKNLMSDDDDHGASQFAHF